MPQQFDSGLASAQRSAIRTAAMTALAPLLKVNGLYLMAVAEMPTKIASEHDEEGLGDAFRVLQGRAPAVLVALGDASFAAAGMPQTRKLGTVELHVYVVDNNTRDLVDGRLAADVVSQGDVTKGPGIETMLEHVQQLLHGQELGVASVYEPELVGEKLIVHAKDMTIWEVTFHVNFDRIIRPLLRDADAPQPVVGIDTTTSIDPTPKTGTEPAPNLLTKTELAAP